jgi:hypothetical protein
MAHYEHCTLFYTHLFLKLWWVEEHWFLHAGPHMIGATMVGLNITTLADEMSDHGLSLLGG